MLDLGVGGGRTVPLLRGLGSDYVALDYVPELVAAARSRHPGTRIELGDARDLSRFADRSFGVVFFSFNGIDGIAHEDRPAVLAEALRVLRPGGLFAYSTHNLDARGAGGSLWAAGRRLVLGEPRAALRAAVRLPRGLASRRRLRPLERAGDDWALLVDAAYGFSVVWHHATLAEARAEPLRAGFAEVDLYDVGGRLLADGGHERQTPWFHVVARAPTAPRGQGAESSTEASDG